MDLIRSFREEETVLWVLLSSFCARLSRFEQTVALLAGRDGQPFHGTSFIRGCVRLSVRKHSATAKIRVIFFGTFWVSACPTVPVSVSGLTEN